MIKVRRLNSRGGNPYTEKLEAVKVSPTGKNPFQKIGAIRISFRFLAGKGSSAMRAYVDSGSFQEVAAAMLAANEDAAIRAFGAALQSHQDPTIQACGQILSDQRKLVETTAAPQTVAA
jgi:hypothetical protein